MQMSVDDTVDMVAVRNRAMSTRSVVRMARGVSGGRIGRRAASRIHLARAENVLVDVSLVDMMQVPVVKIVLVAFVFDGLVPAVGTIRMSLPRCPQVALSTNMTLRKSAQYSLMR